MLGCNRSEPFGLGMGVQALGRGEFLVGSAVREHGTLSADRGCVKGSKGLELVAYAEGGSGVIGLRLGREQTELVLKLMLNVDALPLKIDSSF